MQLVTMSLNTTGFTQFPNVSNLTGTDVEILGFSAYCADQLATAPSGQAVVSSADILNLVCTFQKGSQQLYQNVPYSDLVRARNSGIWVLCQPFTMDLTKSGVATTAAVTASSAAITFLYRTKGKR